MESIHLMSTFKHATANLECTPSDRKVKHCHVMKLSISDTSAVILKLLAPNTLNMVHVSSPYVFSKWDRHKVEFASAHCTVHSEVQKWLLEIILQRNICW